MRLISDNHEVLIFTHPHRTYDYTDYVQHHEEMIGWSEQQACEGMLCSTSSYDYFDPFLWAQYLCSKTDRLKPFIAINPVYLHPYTAARMVATLTHLYQRKIWVNFITGSAKADLSQLNDSLNKEERYERLHEFVAVFTELIHSQSPVNFDGKYYQINKSSLRTPITEALMPGLTVAGESAGALKISADFNIPMMSMLPSENPSFENCHHRSLAFGIITRPTREEAIAASAKLYPTDKFGQKLLQFSMQENETQWKSRIYGELTTQEYINNLYWLEPFRNKFADCPYIIGSYTEIAAYLDTMLLYEPHSIVLTIKNIEEFNHINQVFQMVSSKKASIHQSNTVS